MLWRMPRLAQQSLGLVGGLQVHFQPKGRSVPEDDAEAIEGLPGRICLGMPDGPQSVPYVDLRDICDRNLAQLRQDMEFKR